EAVRGEGADAPDFAVATLQEPLAVLGGRTLTISAFCRTQGDALAAVRAVFFASNDSSPFRFRTGVPLHEHPDWRTEDTILVVPPGCDRLQIELVAVLRSADAQATIDDVAVVEAGTGAALDSKLNESSQTAIGTGAAMAVRSVDPDNPATLLAVLPDRVPAQFAGLHKAGLLVLSDLGATWQCTANERSFQLAANGADSLQFVFPADAAGSLLVRGADGTFASAAAESQFTTRTVLLGDRATRALLQFDADVVCTGQVGGSVYRLGVAVGKAELVLGFRAEKNEAVDLLKKARAELADGRPGAAIDKVRELSSRVPQDSEVLGQALVLRGQILTSQGETLRALQKDLAEATFFDTRGGFQRTVLGVDDLVALYGEHNVEDLAGCKALRAAAQQRLDEIDGAQHGVQRTRLEALGKALAAAQQPELAAAVQDYVQRHLGGK
ncbi:MAG: hypothetical protein Q7T30_03580, partial [Planctomycetota bacterium]|nr:hypothetical protein [Planctomycetota bacterium]